MARFLVGPRGRGGQTFPSSNDVKTLFEDYGRVENCQLKVDKKSLHQRIGCNDSPHYHHWRCDRFMAAWRIMKGIPVRVSMFEKPNMYVRLFLDAFSAPRDPKSVDFLSFHLLSFEFFLEF